MQRLARSIQAPLGEAEAEALAALVAESGLSRWRWVWGAIRAAAADPSVAAAIVAAAPPEGRGGRRPGAGRPPRVSEAAETVVSEGTQEEGQ